MALGADWSVAGTAAEDAVVDIEAHAPAAIEIAGNRSVGRRRSRTRVHGESLSWVTR